jgi:hypothetical protein
MTDGATWSDPAGRGSIMRAGSRDGREGYRTRALGI